MKKYSAPEVCIFTVEITDVITTSPVDDTLGNNYGTDVF